MNIDEPIRGNQTIQSRSVAVVKLRRVKRQMRIYLENSGLQQKAVAIGMGIDPGQLARWLGDGYPDAMGIQHLPDWTREVGPEFEGWLREQSEPEDAGAFTHTPAIALVSMLAKLSGQEISQLIQDIQSGNRWDLLERRQSLPGLTKLRTILDALISDAAADDVREA